MKKIGVLIGTLLVSLFSYAGVITYTPDDVTIFRNPERGFTEELGGETKLSDSKNHVVLAEEDWFFDEEDPENADRISQTLVVLMYYLYNYKTKDLSDKLLAGFDEDMQALRRHGFKCVLRFAYDWKSKNDADLEQVKRHIAQLKPHLSENADVIYAVEAGFVGQWGEWYYSSHFGNETQELNANRKAVLEALLDACPENRFLLVRYPLIKLTYLGDENALTAEEAFSGTPRARLGHHNDAFLNAWGNDGTYGRNGDGPDDDPVLRQYIADETLYVPNGGETNVEDNDDTPNLPEQVYQQAEDEMSRYHWSFCGASYSEEVTNRWRASGIFDNLNRHMGYRLQLLQADLPETATPGKQTLIRLQIRNTGYAPIYNERPAYIVLRAKDDPTAVFRIPLASDPRRWLPNGVVTTVEELVSIPNDIPEGSYELFLHLPDASPSLAADPRYAVRLANEEVWDEESGMNNLHALLSVTPSHERLETPASASPVRKILYRGQLYICIHERWYDGLGRVL